MATGQHGLRRSNNFNRNRSSLFDRVSVNEEKLKKPKGIEVL